MTREQAYKKWLETHYFSTLHDVFCDGWDAQEEMYKCQVCESCEHGVDFNYVSGNIECKLLVGQLSERGIVSKSFSCKLWEAKEGG